jgi:CYTH domain-containing protein
MGKIRSTIMSMKENRGREIERKFLVRKLPADLTTYPSAEISQGYLVSMDDGLQVRLRKAGERYSLTYKRLVVAEVEFDEEKVAKNFQPPDWLGDDVTGDPRYSNQLLAS